MPFGALVAPREAVTLGRDFAGPVGGEDGVGGGALFFRGALAGGGGVVPLGRVGEGLAGRRGPGGKGSLRVVGVGLGTMEMRTLYAVFRVCKLSVSSKVGSARNGFMKHSN